MEIRSLWQATSPHFDRMFQTKVRFVVDGKLRTQVVNSVSDKIIRELPMKGARQMSGDIYA